MIATDYLPPRTEYLHFIDYNTLLRRNIPVYIIGDFNAKHYSLRTTTTPNTIGKHLNTLITQNKLMHLGPNFPTFLRPNSSTTPDMAFSNRNTFHNIHFKSGPLTPSDHIPLITTITANPIQIPIKTRLQLSKADWASYRADLHLYTPDEPDKPTIETIDKMIETWTEEITKASHKHIPKLKYRIKPGIRPTQSLLNLQIQYQAAHEHITRLGPSLHMYNRIKTLRQQLKQQYKTLNDQTWNTLIQKINTEQDPKKFWTSIKKMQGNSKQKVPYLRDHSNNKIHSDEGKEQLLRQHWQNIFRNDNEDHLFDANNIQYVEEYITEHLTDLTPFTHAETTRFTSDTPPITLAEVRTTLKRFKQDAPGPTSITTAHKKNLPDSMLRHFTYILNMTLSAG